MTNEVDAILNYTKEAELIAENFRAGFVTKYVAGGVEHGGNFLDKPALDESCKEVQDLVAYMYSVKKHKEELLGYVHTLLYDLELNNSEITVREMRKLLHFVTDL